MKFQVLERLHLYVLIITFIYLLVSVSTGDVCTSLDIHVEGIVWCHFCPTMCVRRVELRLSGLVTDILTTD